jgi:RHS repeat-associated protein
VSYSYAKRQRSRLCNGSIRNNALTRNGQTTVYRTPAGETAAGRAPAGVLSIVAERGTTAPQPIQVLPVKRPVHRSRTCSEGPFGELLRATGPMAKANPFRFSTKYQDDETDLLYYGYRYYGASTGRWISRDPVGEVGGLSLYGFIENSPFGAVDLYGLSCASCRCLKVKLTAGTAVGGITEPTNPTMTPPPGRGATQRITIGIRTPFSIEVEGDRSQCKCKYTDKGSIKGKLRFRFSDGSTSESPVERTFDPDKNSGDTHPIEGCRDGTDIPGFFLDMGPMPGSLNFELQYDLTVAATCTGSDGVSSISDSIAYNAAFKGSYSWRDAKKGQ